MPIPPPYDDRDSDVDTVVSKELGDDFFAGDEAPQFQNRLFSRFLWNKSVPPIPLESERQDLPFFSASLWSRLWLLWLLPLLQTGYKRTLTHQDLWRLGPELSVKGQYEVFVKHLNDLVTSHQKKHPEDDSWPSNAVLHAAFRTYKRDYIVSVSLLVASRICSVLAPLFLYFLSRLSSTSMSTAPLVGVWA